MRDKAKYFENWVNKLLELRVQANQITGLNPVSALAETIEEQIHSKKISLKNLHELLDLHSQKLWVKSVEKLKLQTGINVKSKPINFSKREIDKPVYQAVFTAHPVFGLSKEASRQLCEAATLKMSSLQVEPFTYRKKVTLAEEHSEALEAMNYARDAINKINREILNKRKKESPNGWKKTLPCMISVATWVGYDLDGRDDINWIDSFCIRLLEKVTAIESYLKQLKNIKEAAGITKILSIELERTAAFNSDLQKIKNSPEKFAKIANTFTNSKRRLLDSKALSKKLHKIAIETNDENDCLKLMVIAADLEQHGFGFGEIHLRVNAAQIRNAMRPVDGKPISTSDSPNSQRLLIERLAQRIKSEVAWEINFKTIDEESALARRQLMLAKQIIKHIDKNQKIKLLIAECEKPLTIMSALYLAHKFDICNQLDISPLFETSFGLEHGSKIIEQLLDQSVFLKYVKKRKRLTIQTGFSDAGRFMGQIAANMAIERLQLKIIRCLKNKAQDKIKLLFFNTHGESFGRGGTQSKIFERQAFIMTPRVRAEADALGIELSHQSSFQGGDGYRLFGSRELAYSTMKELLRAEISLKNNNDKEDLFYQKTDFSLDLFTELKDWHEKLLSDPNYEELITLFDGNLLPVTGSRPSKRTLKTDSSRSGPSKIRAISHNATLQQLGFLANVISGIGHAANIDIEEFIEIYKKSNRLKQCLNIILTTKKLGSLSTMQAYCQIFDPSFWINQAHRRRSQKNQRALRTLSNYLQNFPKFTGTQKIVLIFKDDLVDLYKLIDRLNQSNIEITNETNETHLDVLHAIRIAVIAHSLILICKTPKLGETNLYSNHDILNFGLSLDLESVIEIINNTFSNNSQVLWENKLVEPETYSGESAGNIAAIKREILDPLAESETIIKKITQMISAMYGAHG